MAATRQYKYLTPAQVDSFLTKGYLKLSKAFTPEQAAEWTSDIWIKLGMDPNDKSTWTKERIHMPQHRTERVQDFSPLAWAAMCELLGGEDRVDPDAHWSDGWIVNLGKDGMETEGIVPPKSLDNWHCDGDNFRHHLDSPNQALLVIPLFSTIHPRGGGTYISPDGIAHVARFLADHPEGVGPGEDENGVKDLNFDFRGIVNKCEEFEEMTGEVGDVILMHPFMLHSASHNQLREARIIINPPVSLKSGTSFHYSRPDPADYSLVELKTISALEADPDKGGFEFKITRERQKVVPARLKAQNILFEQEKKRLAAVKVQVQRDAMAVAAH